MNAFETAMVEYAQACIHRRNDEMKAGYNKLRDLFEAAAQRAAGTITSESDEPKAKADRTAEGRAINPESPEQSTFSDGANSAQPLGAPEGASVRGYQEQDDPSYTHCSPEILKEAAQPASPSDPTAWGFTFKPHAECDSLMTCQREGRCTFNCVVAARAASPSLGDARDAMWARRICLDLADTLEYKSLQIMHTQIQDATNLRWQATGAKSCATSILMSLGNPTERSTIVPPSDALDALREFVWLDAESMRLAELKNSFGIHTADYVREQYQAQYRDFDKRKQANWTRQLTMLAAMNPETPKEGA